MVTILNRSLFLRKLGGMKALIALLAASALMMSACGDSTPTEAAQSDDAQTDQPSGDAQDAAAEADQPSEEQPTIVVSTNIMGDVVENVVGDAATVVTIMPVGADPHDFQPSAKQIAELNDADAVIMNGGGFEEGLLDIVEAAEADGMIVFEAMSVIETLEFSGHDDHDDHEDDHDDHDDHEDDDDHDDHDDDHKHEHADGDPHFFTDPARVALAADAIAEFVIAEVDGIDGAAVRATADDYVAELTALDEEISEALSAVADADRVLVTNHEVLAYFADRYDFEIIGAVIPGGTTVDSANAEALAELAEIVEAEGIPAIFSDNSSSDELAQTLALEAGNVEVVELYSESLGAEDSDGATYVEMMRTNAERIAAALTR